MDELMQIRDKLEDVLIHLESVLNVPKHGDTK